MRSVHAIRWIENLKDTSFELYWYDIMNRGKLNTIESVTQFYEIKKRKLPHIKGEHTLSKKFPVFYEKVRPILETTENELLESIIEKIQPDVIHSFEMFSSTCPILKTMNKYKNIKWIYSCWGSDLFYYQNIKSFKNKIEKSFKRIDYIHTDCQRDYDIALKLGFQGKHLGIIPGGTGFRINELHTSILPVQDRKIILVKGYQHKFGKALEVIKALETITSEILNYQIVVFGAHKPVIDHILKKNLPYKIYSRNELSHNELMCLMGKSLIYIGNSISDGMPNTMLEAITMGAFPIQSNPGGVSEEIINHNKNGFLIKNPEDSVEIGQLIINIISNRELLEKAHKINTEIAKNKLDYDLNKQKIINLYQNMISE